jgi:hypothetical protein
VSLKSLTTGVAAATLVGAAAAGVTSIALVPTSTVSPAVTPVVFGVPLPEQPSDTASPGELAGILNQIANGSTITENASLIQGGLGPFEGRQANRALNEARAEGQLPLSISVASVSPPAPDGSVTAQVTASGPKMAPVTRPVTFVPGGPQGWMVSKSSAYALLSAVGSG